MRKALLLLVIAASNLLAWADPICQHVGGGIVTNFLNSTTTFGSATGDLGGGIGVEDRGEIHVAAQQPDALAVFEVDGWKQDHGAHRRKLPIKARPRAWLFSG